jgi:methionyl-tRNA formyltransferase
VVIRVVFLGTPEFAVPSLKRLIESPEVEVEGVVTQPDRRSGRGQKYDSPPVKEIAEIFGIPIRQFSSIRKDLTSIQWLRELNPDACVVVAFGQILPEAFFDFPPLGTLNVHASLLPAYRGAAPVIHTLLNGDSETGVTIMKIDAGMDTGQILSQERIEVSQEINAGSLEEQLAETGAQLLVETLLRYAKHEILPGNQDHSRATYAPRVDRKMARISWAEPARVVHNLVRAMNPRPGAYTFLRGEMIKVWRSRVSDRSTCGQNPGTITEFLPNQILVACDDGRSVGLLELQVPNRKRVNASDFANGLRLETGERFE